jgi:hypothetical protein
MSLVYTIQVTKDHAQVAATWDISVDNPELIASFTLNVEGKPLDTKCSSGNSQCKGAAQATLSKPDQDCSVSFVITTNAPEEKHGDDVLRGNRTFDDVEFENS